MVIYLDTYFSTSDVTDGEYSWTGATTPGSNTLSGSSKISTVVANVYTSDFLTAGSFTIEVSGSTYTITGTVTTSKGDARFSYTVPVNLVVPQ